MRRISLEDWKKERRAKFKIAVDVENSLPDRLPGRRPRDPEKEKILIQLEKARREQLIRTGKIEIIGPRHWRWHIEPKG
jgi:hypothetical protein